MGQSKYQQKNFGTTKDKEALEERLLEQIETYLSYKVRCYQDNPVDVLQNLYCLKKHPGPPPDRSKGRKEGWLSNLLARVPGHRGEGQLYIGIDGNFYRESELQFWFQAHPLLLVLRKKINEGNFDPEW
ncbi:hypothetical protein KGY77_05775 [Candidatus Bipolaricaulota bacterium]|nr:hypothetical protein [Candidatus Bipolaricaulota bacterium]